MRHLLLLLYFTCGQWMIFQHRIYRKNPQFSSWKLWWTTDLSFSVRLLRVGSDVERNKMIFHFENFRMHCGVTMASPIVVVLLTLRINEILWCFLPCYSAGNNFPNWCKFLSMCSSRDLNILNDWNRDENNYFPIFFCASASSTNVRATSLTFIDEKNDLVKRQMLMHLFHFPCGPVHTLCIVY